ncbi:MAG TPA: hypothetical protein VEH77_16580 [Roseiarcus sp.]|nr:hypothetical protein [Roseiarcus sp.]
MSAPSDSPPRRALEELLPWYAAGTLSRREAREVEAALAQHPELARRYELVREELAATVQLNETLGAPSAQARERLFAAIDAEPQRRPAPWRVIGPRLAGLLAGLSPRSLAWSASAAALLIFVQLALIGVMLAGGREHIYQPASISEASGGDGAYVLVRFAPQASAEAITKFLAANQASIVGGPAPGGIYRVRVAPAPLARAELQALVKQLAQSSDIVGFIAGSD